MCVPSLDVPSNENDLRRYTDGVNSILANIPTPKINITEDGSACVLPSQVLRIYLSLGIKPHVIKSLEDVDTSNGVSMYWQSEQAINEMEELAVPNDSSTGKVLMCVWSDGFDPNGKNKCNRGSVHVISMSLLAAHNQNEFMLSFVVALSREECDHASIRKIISDDIESMRHPQDYYDGEKIVSLQFIKLAQMTDRPERSDHTQIAAHNGKYTMRFGHVCPADTKLYSCSKCFDLRKKRVKSFSSRTCRSCYDFDSLKVTFDPPDKYPTALKQNKKKMRAKKLVFTDMITSAVTAYKILTEKMECNGN